MPKPQWYTSTTWTQASLGGELNHGINPRVILCLYCYTCVLVVVEVISRIEADLLMCGVPTTFMDKLMRAEAAQRKLKKHVRKHKKVASEARWESDQAYVALGEIETKKQRLDMDMDKEGATLKDVKGSKFLDKRSTQVGGASS